MEEVDIVIVGAGIVGLAIANEISDGKKNIIVVERYYNFGNETSSRNSEVVHAGIYYTPGSLKAKFCVEGNELIYDICKKKNINCLRIGKLIVVENSEGIAELKELYETGCKNGVQGLKILDKSEVKKNEPNINAYAALYSPNTGILDTHNLMRYFEASAKDKGIIFAYRCEVVNIEQNKNGFFVRIKDIDKNEIKISTKLVINAAGLYSGKIAEMVGIDIKKNGYKTYYCKGEYFSVCGGKGKFIKHLIYPRPTPISIGIHTVLDLQGELKLGPNAFYVNEINYDVDKNHKDEFYNGIKNILPFIKYDDLSPAMAGIRPKIQAEGESVKDFVIRDEYEKGLPGFINLVGIESPGLTSSPAIARYVKTLIQKYI